MGMLAHEERLEAARFEGVRQFADIDAVIGRKVESANEHGTPPRLLKPSGVCADRRRPNHGYGESCNRS
jgi:hypothetical protein